LSKIQAFFRRAQGKIRTKILYVAGFLHSLHMMRMKGASFFLLLTSTGRAPYLQADKFSGQEASLYDCNFKPEVLTL